tara:strand:+ start:212 stop:331 length:120 start_codon:yes stop_codon:yes gene_type:complete
VGEKVAAAAAAAAAAAEVVVEEINSPVVGSTRSQCVRSL